MNKILIEYGTGHSTHTGEPMYLAVFFFGKDKYSYGFLKRRIEKKEFLRRAKTAAIKKADELDVTPHFEMKEREDMMQYFNKYDFSKN